MNEIFEENTDVQRRVNIRIDLITSTTGSDIFNVWYSSSNRFPQRKVHPTYVLQI